MKHTKALILTLAVMALSLVGLYACGGASPTASPVPPTVVLLSPTTNAPPNAPATPTTAAISTAPAEAATPAGQPTTNTSTGSGSGHLVSGKIGDALTLDNATLQVTSVRRSSGGFVRPANGNEYVILTVTVTNKGTQDLPILSLSYFGLTDGSGNQHGVSVTADYSSPSSDFDSVADGNIKAGSSVSGEIGFQVKQGDKNLTLTFWPAFSSDIGTTDSITVKIDQ
jgi:hypothetical protein